jgi:hypothetical protein
VRFIPTAAAIIQIGYAADAPVRAADRTLMGTLGEGVYLLRVRLRPGEGGTGGGMLAVAASPAVKQVIGDLGPETDFTPYAAGDSEAFLISRHPGGPIYVSQFDSSPGAGIAGVGAFALQPLGEEAGPGREPSRPLPEFASWVPMRATGVEARPQGAEVLVEGNDSAGGYQLVSPAVAIAPNHRVTVSVPTRIEQGNVCIGVLNETEQLWLVPPDRSGNQFRFESGKNRAMKVVLANCNGSGSARRSRFVVARGSYSEGSDELYTDFLIAGVR